MESSTVQKTIDKSSERDGRFEQLTSEFDYQWQPPHTRWIILNILSLLNMVLYWCLKRPNINKKRQRTAHLKIQTLSMNWSSSSTLTNLILIKSVSSTLILCAYFQTRRPNLFLKLSIRGPKIIIIYLSSQTRLILLKSAVTKVPLNWKKSAQFMKILISWREIGATSSKNLKSSMRLPVDQ